jgi:hypothetical protein
MNQRLTTGQKGEFDQPLWPSVRLVLLVNRYLLRREVAEARPSFTSGEAARFQPETTAQSHAVSK